MTAPTKSRVPVLRVKDYQRTTLKPRHKVTVKAFAEALFSSELPFPRGRLDAFVDDVDDAMSNASKTLRFGLKLMLDAVRWTAPLLLTGKFSLFEDLTTDERVKVLEAMENGKIMMLQLVFVAYKTVMTMVYFEEEEELISLGYPGPERARYRLAPGYEASSERAP